MPSAPATVDEYLAALSPERRKEMQALREVILENLDFTGYEEGIQYGIIGYYVPHRVFPAGYHCDPKQPLPFVAIGAKKNYISLHLMCVYGNAGLNTWFREQWKKSGKKLDMGKACVRIKSVGDAPLHVIGQAIKRVPAKKYIAWYTKVLDARGKPAKKTAGVKSKPASPRKKVVKKAAARKKPAPRRASAS